VGSIDKRTVETAVKRMLARSLLPTLMLPHPVPLHPFSRDCPPAVARPQFYVPFPFRAQ
jgi:hypothetical protein